MRVFLWTVGVIFWLFVSAAPNEPTTGLDLLSVILAGVFLYLILRNKPPG